MKKFIFLLVLIFMSSMSYLSAQDFTLSVLEEPAVFAEEGSPIDDSKAGDDLVLTYLKGGLAYITNTTITQTSYLSGCISFTANQMADYTGCTLNSMEIAFPAATSGMATATESKIWVKGSLTGEVLYEQIVTPTLGSSVVYPLTTPYVIPAGSLVIGFTVEFTVTASTAVCPYWFSAGAIDPYQVGGFYRLTSTSPTAHGEGAAWLTYTSQGNLSIKGHCTTIPLNNDIKIVAENPLLYTKAPASQVASIPFITTLSAQAKNVGVNTQTGITFSATLNGAALGASASVASLAADATTAAMTITPPAGTEYPSTGNSTLVYTVSQSETDQNLANNSGTYILTVGDKYQLDNMAICSNGFGTSAATGGSYGNIYNIYATTYLTAVEVGHGSTTALAYTLSLFKMTGTTTIESDPLFTVNVNRVPGFTTIPVPYTELTPGDYYLCVNQLTNTNISITYDTRSTARRSYSKTLTGTALAVSTFGASAIRMIVEDPVTVVITTNVSPENSGTVTGGGEYLEGQTVTLTASANQGYSFVNWNTGSTDNPLIFTATTNATYTANFAVSSPGTDCNDVVINPTPGTSSTFNLPICTNYEYSYTQQIYIADEIGSYATDVMLTAISFEYIFATPATKANQTIYLAHTNKTFFTGTSNWEPYTNFTQVFSGTVDFSNSDTWSTIVFDVPFLYTGGNLVVAVLNNDGNIIHPTTSTIFRTTDVLEGTTPRSIYRRSDVPLVHSSIPAGTSTFVRPARAMFKVCTEGQGGDCNPATNLEVAYLPGNIAELTWDPPVGGKSSLTPVFAPENPNKESKEKMRTKDKEPIEGTMQRRAPQPSSMTVETPSEPFSFRGNDSPLIYATPASPWNYMTGETYKTTLGAISGTHQQLSTIYESYQAMEFVDGTIYVVTYDDDYETNSFGTFDPNTGVFTVIKSIGAPDAISMAWNPIDNNVYVVQWGSSTSCPFGKVDIATGNYTSLGSVPGYLYITIDNNGVCYGVGGSLLEGKFGTINLANGSFTQISTSDPINYIQDLFIDRETNELYYGYRADLSSTTPVRNINKTTGAFTVVGTFSVGVESLITITYPGDPCEVASNLNVTVTGNDAALTWTAATGCSSYDVLRNGTVITNVSTTSYTDVNVPNGLHTYCVKALFPGSECFPQSTCAQSVMIGDMCYVRLELLDDYGDGWNDAAISISVNGTSYGTFGMASGYNATHNVLIPSGNVQFTWNEGVFGGYFDDECSFAIYDKEDFLLYSCADASVLSGQFFTYNNDCSKLATRYNVYRDEVLIAPNIAALTYLDVTFDPYEGHTWCVTVVCDNLESDQICETKEALKDNGCAGAKVGDGTTGVGFPIQGYYYYTYTQELLTAADLGLATGEFKTINSLSFQYNHAVPVTRSNVNIYLANTNKTNFDGTAASNFVPGSELQLVWSGNLSMSNGWVEIEFTTPFLYEGGGLVVAIQTGLSPNYYGGSADTRHLAHSTTNYATLSYYGDGGTININSPSATNMYRYQSRNNFKFEICPPPPVDMQAINITGANKNFASELSNFTITVKNGGADPATNFTVSLFTEDDVLLGSTLVTQTLAKGGTMDVIISFIPSTDMVGKLCLKGRVDIVDDVDESNDETEPLCVFVLPEALVDFTIQSGPLATASNQIPFNFSNNSSMVQTIYMESEINVDPGKTIQVLSYNYTATVPLNSGTAPIKVYITHTNLTNLSAGWIPVSQFNNFTPVYEGIVSFTTTTAPNIYELIIILPQPFVYEGGNLCIMTERPLLAPFTSGITAQIFTASPTNRTRHYSNNTTPFNPTTPQTGNLLSTVPVLNVYKLKTYTLNPNNIFDAEKVTITLDPDPIEHGGSGTVYFASIDACSYISTVIIDGQIIVPTPTQYTFTNVTATLPVIEILTSYNKKDITVTYGPNGAILVDNVVIPNGNTVLVDCGSNQTFQIRPDKDYTIASLEINGETKPIPANRKYTFIEVKENSTIHATFVEYPQCIISFESVPVNGGDVIPVDREDEMVYGFISVDSGTMYQQFLFVPAPNYTLQAVYIDGILNNLATISGSYVFTNIITDHHIKAIFKINEYTIIATAGTNGSITPSGNVLVLHGTNKKFDFTPITGYVVDQVFVDNVPNAAAALLGSYTFTNVTGNHTIHVTFKKATLVIHISWGEGGTVFPEGNTYTPTGTNSGDVYVFYNDIQKLLFTPQEGYKVSMVYVNGAPYPNAIPIGSYTFYYITEESWFHVTFEKYTYPITSKVNGNGMILPFGTTYVPHGDSQTYTFYAMEGYKIANVFIDGIDNAAAIANGTHTFTNVTAPHTIDVITVPLTYKISAVAGTGGFITPAGEITVTYGGSQYFTFAAASGYEIEKVLVDGLENMEALQNGAYAFVNVKEDHTINVFFKILTFKVAALSGSNGFISPEGISIVTYGEDITYTITPDEGYKVSFVLVNGDNMGDLSTYTFMSVEADGTIEAFFVKNIVGIDDPSIEGIGIYSHANVVYIVNEKQLPISDVSIFDMYGRVVWQGKPVGQKIELNVANGIYAVRVWVDDQFTTKRVSIQR